MNSVLLGSSIRIQQPETTPRHVADRDQPFCEYSPPLPVGHRQQVKFRSNLHRNRYDLILNFEHFRYLAITTAYFNQYT